MSSKLGAVAVVLCHLGLTHGHPADVQRRDDQVFQYGVIGDSYASGVTYGLGSHNNYDDNESGCMRVKHAYGVQLQSDWPAAVQPRGNLTFAACSGAHLVDMAQGKRQMDSVAKDSHFVTMQAGGNDAGFFDVATDCIYHQIQNKDYGEQYPGKGACVDSINNVNNYITRWTLPPWLGPRNLGWDMGATISDVLAHPNAQTPSFKLYVIGYAHFFNDLSPDSDWCNEKSFTWNFNEIRGKNVSVKLTHDLRARINQLTTDLNAKIQEVVKNRNDPKVVYLSITEGFDGRRFCEKGASWWGQYYGSSVWFWNASPEGLWNVERVSSPYVEEFQDAIIKNDTKVLEQFNWTDLLAVEKGPEAQEPYRGWTSGSALRPFHPKEPGHGAIKQVIHDQITTDFPAPVQPASPPAPTALARPACWSPDHDNKVRFARDHGLSAIADFKKNCNQKLTSGGMVGCIDNDHPVDESEEGWGDDNPVIVMSVEQIFWPSGQTESTPSSDILGSTIQSIMDDCDTDAGPKDKWGGWTIIGDENTGIWRYNITAQLNPADVPHNFIGEGGA